MNERTNQQTSRVGWRPRKIGKARLAGYIARSILDHAAAGVSRKVSDYTTDADVAHLVGIAMKRLQQDRQA